MIAWGLGLAAVLLLGVLVMMLATERKRSRIAEQLLATADAKLEDMQRQFERFASPDVVERLTDAADAYTPERRRVTMLFADLRGFTALCDQHDPGVAVKILNDYFRHMNQAIGRHHGHVTEFVGDGLLALFGATEANPWQERDAVLAAQAMRSELALCNVSLKAEGLPELRFGIGIHCGEVVAGVIGTAGLSKFSVTGDPINVASRVEGLTSKYQVDLLVTDDIRRALDESFRLRAMPPALVKGKTEPIQTYYVEPDVPGQGASPGEGTH